MGGYLSERDGDFYVCACGETTFHSYLLSARDGQIKSCCVENGWETFEHAGIWQTKKPEETRQDVINRASAYTRWYTEVDWNRYHTDKNYQETMSKKLRNSGGVC